MRAHIYIYVYINAVKPLFMQVRKLCDFVVLTKKFNNIYANQILGQSTCVKSFIFVRSYLCALTTPRIIQINNITTKITEFTVYTQHTICTQTNNVV